MSFQLREKAEELNLIIFMGSFQLEMSYDSIHRDYQQIFIFSLKTLSNPEYRLKLSLITTGSVLGP